MITADSEIEINDVKEDFWNKILVDFSKIVKK